MDDGFGADVWVVLVGAGLLGIGMLWFASWRHRVIARRADRARDRRMMRELQREARGERERAARRTEYGHSA